MKEVNFAVSMELALIQPLKLENKSLPLIQNRHAYIFKPHPIKKFSNTFLFDK